MISTVLPLSFHLSLKSEGLKGHTRINVVPVGKILEIIGVKLPVLHLGDMPQAIESRRFPGCYMVFY